MRFSVPGVAVDASLKQELEKISSAYAESFNRQDGAGRRDPGNRPQRAAGGHWLHAGRDLYRRRQPRRRRYRLGLLPGSFVRAIAFERKQAPEGRGGQIPRHRPGCVESFQLIVFAAAIARTSAESPEPPWSIAIPSTPPATCSKTCAICWPRPRRRAPATAWRESRPIVPSK